MTRLVGAGTEARGSISLVARLDLRNVEDDERTTAIAELTSILDAGSTVEIVVADLGDHAPAAAQHLAELADGGVHIKLCGPPLELRDWLAALRPDRP